MSKIDSKEDFFLNLKSRNGYSSQSDFIYPWSWSLLAIAYISQSSLQLRCKVRLTFYSSGKKYFDVHQNMKLVSIIDGWTVDMIFNSFIIFSQLIWLMFTNTNPPPPYFDMWQESTHICAKSSGRTITFHAAVLQGFWGQRSSQIGSPNMNDVYKYTNTYSGLWQESTHRARFAEDDINSSWLDSPVETHNCVQVYYWLWAMSIFGSYPCYLRIFFPIILSQVRSQKSSFIGKTPNYWGGGGVWNPIYPKFCPFWP